MVLLPAYNAEKTLEATVRELPDLVDERILVDDHSDDQAVAISRPLLLRGALALELGDLGVKIVDGALLRGLGGGEAGVDAFRVGQRLAHPDGLVLDAFEVPLDGYEALADSGEAPGLGRSVRSSPGGSRLSTLLC
jgi:hypothetical protein